MQQLIQVTKIRPAIIGLLSVMAVALLFSCSKNAADNSLTSAEETNAANSSSANGNTIHAVPFETTLFVPCANGGAGEQVTLTGFTNFVQQLSWTNNGFTMVYHDNMHHVTGTGALSGETFVASGAANGIVRGSWTNDQWVGKLIRQTKVIGQHTRFTVTYKYHITVTAAGNVTVNSTEQSAVCD